MSVFVDTHCHLNLAPLKQNLTDVIHRAQLVGVQQFIVPAVQASNWPYLEQLYQKKHIHCGIGLHPCFSHQPDDLDAMAARLEKAHDYIAIGECGLDAIRSPYPMAEQILLCARQLQLAQQHRLPVILHVRKAHNELLQLLQQYPLPCGGVLHGFSGSFELAQQYIRHKLKLGIGGVITYPRATKTRQTISRLLLTSLLLETDSPDMPLCGHQGLSNEPRRLTQIFDCLCQLRGESPAKIKNQIHLNCQDAFCL